MFAAYCSTQCHLALNKVKQLLGTALNTHWRQFRQSCTNRELAGLKMNCKCLCVYPRVQYCANTEYLMQHVFLTGWAAVICKSLSDNILTPNSSLHVFMDMNVCGCCMHMNFIALQVCKAFACSFHEPVLTDQSYCRAVVYTNHRVIASHFAYWVSCYPGQLCRRKLEPVLYAKHMETLQKYSATNSLACT